jgi:hypothetical protein
MLRAISWTSVAAFVLAGCSASERHGHQRSDEIGSVGMKLTVAPGIELTMLDWVVLDDGSSAVLSSDSDGQAPWSGATADASEFLIGGVPAGGPYTLQLLGETSEGGDCDGTSTEFDVTAGATTTASVDVTCEVPGNAIPVVVESGSVMVSGVVSVPRAVNSSPTAAHLRAITSWTPTAPARTLPS